MSQNDALVEPINLAADNGYSQSIELASVPEFRRNARVDEFILAEATAESGEVVVGIIVDISFSGLRLEGGRLLVDALLPRSNLKNKYLPAPLRISFTLPETSAHGISAKIRCNAIYSRSLDEYIYQIGMQFIEFEEGSAGLAEYLISKGLT